MSRILGLGVVLMLAIALGACSTSTPVPPAAAASPMATITNQPTESVPVTGNTETSVAPATNVPADTTGTSTADAGLATSTSETPSGTTIDASVRIGTSTSTSASQPFLVDQMGRALYLFTEDTQNDGSSACTGECLNQWPPLVVTGIPQAGNGVDASLLGTITRDDGTLQATYNGWPLYLYIGDTGPGTTSGQGAGGVWFLVSGTGNSIPQ